MKEQNSMLMKTLVFYLFELLFVFLAIGCDKEERPPYPYYAEMEDEEITQELENVPGYVVRTELDCVFICYSEYADEYALEYFNDGLSTYQNMDEAIQKDLKGHTIGVAKTDFEKSRLSIPCKVYFSASVTNNIFKCSEDDFDYVFCANAFYYKAYLKDVKSRN